MPIKRGCAVFNLYPVGRTGSYCRRSWFRCSISIRRPLVPPRRIPTDPNLHLSLPLADRELWHRSLRYRNQRLAGVAVVVLGTDHLGQSSRRISVYRAVLAAWGTANTISHGNSLGASRIRTLPKSGGSFEHPPTGEMSFEESAFSLSLSIGNLCSYSHYCLEG